MSINYHCMVENMSEKLIRQPNNAQLVRNQTSRRTGLGTVEVE